MLENLVMRQVLPPLIFAVAMLVLFWYLIMRPAKQRQDRHQQLIESLENGDKVITAGGIYGTVVRVLDKTVQLKIADGVVVTMDRRAVRRRQTEEAG